MTFLRYRISTFLQIYFSYLCDWQCTASLPIMPQIPSYLGTFADTVSLKRQNEWKKFMLTPQEGKLMSGKMQSENAIKRISDWHLHGIKEQGEILQTRKFSGKPGGSNTGIKISIPPFYCLCSPHPQFLCYVIFKTAILNKTWSVPGSIATAVSHIADVLLNTGLN